MQWNKKSARRACRYALWEILAVPRKKDWKGVAADKEKPKDPIREERKITLKIRSIYIFKSMPASQPHLSCILKS